MLACFCKRSAATIFPPFNSPPLPHRPASHMLSPTEGAGLAAAIAAYTYIIIYQYIIAADIYIIAADTYIIAADIYIIVWPCLSLF